MKTFNEILAALIISVAKELSSVEPKQNCLTQVNLTDYIKLDNEYMKAEKDGKFIWYETDILLNNFLDEDCEGSIAELVNIFQVNENDPRVYKFQHFANGQNKKDWVDGFWIENFPLEGIKITYEEALSKVQEVNLSKPHSRHVCLRNPIGPKACNPQWIFGNIHSQIWVDAVTGEVRESNPAFLD